MAMTEPDYRSFESKNQGGSYLDELEKELHDELVQYRLDHPKPWYLQGKVTHLNRKKRNEHQS
jgi:hypothetical protein